MLIGLLKTLLSWGMYKQVNTWLLSFSGLLIIQDKLVLCFSNQKIKKHNWYHPLFFHKVWSNLMLKFHSQNVGVFSLSLYFVIQWKAIEQMIFIFIRRQMFCYWLCRKLIDGCRSADDMMHIWKPALWFLILHLFTCDSLFSITTVKHFLVIWGKKLGISKSTPSKS